ncbi:inverse autotransporter beta domain-containing protein [Spirulina sp. CS-785/01]|uniref:inverse autotransporter beta domain-containing protein n=1 Tax=Spirulina sp. CS-785/01 TaxID=3021716 RepID=UPI00232EC72C|nr:inverse autotransporter beta domain-containing protein [Spirulina sp. CS-785/01]MDB9314475.1 inverse autotransporter beta domain-containing protein [Spirulina sp. CS-785/01]
MAINRKNKLGWLLLGCIAGGSIYGASGANANPNPSDSTPVSELQTQPVSLLQPRITIHLDTGPGVGYSSSFSSLHGFFPLAQTPTRTFFGEGRLNLFAENEVGGNLRFGYRQHQEENNLVWGGYIGYDLRETQFNETFQQIGLGGEILGENWEARLNSYLPLGERRRQVDFADTGPIISNLRFQGNQLLFSTFRQQTRTFEASALGVDLEGGYRLLDWNQGSLYAYLGTYYFDLPSNGTYLGIHGRLLAELNEVYRVGLAVSSDRNFGTNLTVQVAATLGGRPPRKQEETLAESILTRLGQPVRRRDTLMLNRQQEDTITQQDNIVARNPATGHPWRFLHVTGGITGGNGTFERPVGEVTDAVALAETTGNDVVYVDAGSNPGLDGFTIPNNVRVLSTGVPQVLNLLDFGPTQLPGSGTGVLPRLNGTTVATGEGFNTMVSMGNNAILSGFGIETDQAIGVYAPNVSNFRIDRNQITTRGVLGSFNAEGIFLRAEGERVTNAVITDNTVTTLDFDGDGISGSAENGGILSNLVISGNRVTTSGDQGTGIVISASPGGIVRDITVSGNRVSTSGNIAGGIAPVAIGGTLRNFIVSNNTVATSGNQSSAISVETDNGGTVSEVIVVNNTIRQARRSSVAAITLDTGDDLCIAEVSGNTNLDLGAVNGVSGDVEVSVTGGSILNFVDFNRVTVNNTGFDTIEGTPTGQPRSCP